MAKVILLRQLTRNRADYKYSSLNTCMNCAYPYCNTRKAYVLPCHGGSHNICEWCSAQMQYESREFLCPSTNTAIPGCTQEALQQHPGLLNSEAEVSNPEAARNRVIIPPPPQVPPPHVGFPQVPPPRVGLPQAPIPPPPQPAYIAQDLICPCCRDLFGSRDHIPIEMPVCKHAVCNLCLPQLYQNRSPRCPLCNAGLPADPPTNPSEKFLTDLKQIEVNCSTPGHEGQVATQLSLVHAKAMCTPCLREHDCRQLVSLSGVDISDQLTNYIRQVQGSMDADLYQGVSERLGRLETLSNNDKLAVLHEMAGTDPGQEELPSVGVEAKVLRFGEI